MNLEQLSRALQSLDSQAAETVQAAVKEIAALKGENSLLTDALANYEQENARLQKDNDEIHGLVEWYRVENTKLWDALEDFGEHDPACALHYPRYESECDCGLDTILSRRTP